MAPLRVVDNPESFHAEARYQGACANCRKMGGEWEAHHVVEKQECKKRGAALYDTRNALRLCIGPGSCHGGQHTITNVKLCVLTDDNLTFAFEVLGAGAYDYLRRRYDGEDPRVDAMLNEIERIAS
jgi:hypothetical protein